MAETTQCPECGNELPPGLPLGLCPRCIVGDETMEPGPNALENESGAVLPRSLGDYELLEKIASGGMGVVYKARQKSLERIVAVKMLLSGSFAGDELVRRFKVEATSTARLCHPNIVAIHEVGWRDGQHFLVMDYVDGPNLATLVRDQPLSPKRAATFVRTIAEAIHYAHEKDILHRDLKPSNILVDSNDQPHVTDFGLARHIDGESSLTLSGQVLGSLNYMPPEQAAALHRKVSRQSDVYGLGAILYHLLTGRPPFQGATIAETMHQVQQQDPVAPRLLSPGVPLDLETICLKCLEKEPAKRYGTAKELAEEIARLLGGEPIQARPIGPAIKALRWCSRKPALAASAGVALLFFLVIVIGSPLMTVRIARQRERAERQTQQAQAALTRLRIERAESMFASGNSSRALANLARLLRQQPTNNIAADRLMSAFAYRRRQRFNTRVSSCPVQSQQAAIARTSKDFFDWAQSARAILVGMARKS